MAKAKGKRLGAKLVERFTKFADQLERLEASVDPAEVFTIRGRAVRAPEPHTPALVIQTRNLLNVSQPVFAGLLGVSVSSVRDWEQGLKPAPGPARRLMTEIRAQPSYWTKQLKFLVVEPQKGGKSAKLKATVRS